MHSRCFWLQSFQRGSHVEIWTLVLQVLHLWQFVAVFAAQCSCSSSMKSSSSSRAPCKLVSVTRCIVGHLWSYTSRTLTEAERKLLATCALLHSRETPFQVTTQRSHGNDWIHRTTEGDSHTLSQNGHDVHQDDDEFYLNLQDAIDVIRQARVARGFHPVVIPASTADVVIKKRSEPGKKGSTKGSGKRGAGSRGKGKGQLQEADRRCDLELYLNGPSRMDRASEPRPPKLT